MDNNWKLIKTHYEIFAWSNNKTSANIFIKCIQSPIKAYILEFEIKRKSLSKKFDSLGECKSFAIEWMNNNPSPDYTAYKQLSQNASFSKWY